MQRYFEKDNLFSTHSQEPTQRYVKRAVMSEQSIVATEFCTETQEDKNNEQKTPKRSHRFKEARDNIQYEENWPDRLNSKTRIELYI